MIVKTVRDREKGQDGKLKNEKNGWLGRAIRFFVRQSLKKPPAMQVDNNRFSLQ